MEAYELRGEMWDMRMSMTKIRQGILRPGSSLTRPAEQGSACAQELVMVTECRQLVCAQSIAIVLQRPASHPRLKQKPDRSRFVACACAGGLAHPQKVPQRNNGRQHAPSKPCIQLGLYLPPT